MVEEDAHKIEGSHYLSLGQGSSLQSESGAKDLSTRVGISSLGSLHCMICLSSLYSHKKNKQSWTRTPRDASGFLPLKLKLDATSKLLSCPFFIYFIYMALDAKTFSFAHSHCDHQSKGWVLKEYKQNHKPRHNFQQNSICNLERLLLLAMLNTFQKTGIPDICLLTFILSLR